MVNINDVAKHAGVAISTVSKVLNHYPNVSEKTKKKVNKSIEELHYIPNSIAAALSSKRGMRIALILNLNTKTQAIDEITMQYLSGALEMAKRESLDAVTVFFSMIADMTLEELVRYLQSQSVSGIIIYGISKDDRVLSELVKKQIFKAVVVDAPFVNQNTTSVWINQEKAQYEVAKKAVSANQCKKLLYIAGKKNGYVTDGRLKGILRLKEELCLSVRIYYGDFSELKARNIALKYAKNVDLIVCASDLMAIGAMNACVDMDIFRPVCGFDGITLMGYVGKQMNTVRQDFYRISQIAVEEMLLLLKGREGRSQIVKHEVVKLQYKDIIC